MVALWGRAYLFKADPMNKQKAIGHNQFFPGETMLLTKPQPTKQPQLLNIPSVDLCYLESLAVVEQAIIPQSLGRVEYQGSSWPAICLQNITLNPGEIVKVIGRYNITLLVTRQNHITDRSFYG